MTRAEPGARVAPPAINVADLPPGVVVVDRNGDIVSLNAQAQATLGPAVHAHAVPAPSLVGHNMIAAHRAEQREAVRSHALPLLDGTAGAAPGPVVALMNIPDRLLLLTMTTLHGDAGPAGACIVFYDVTTLVTRAPARTAEQEPRRLVKIPVQHDEHIGLIDIEDVVRLEADGHHTVVVTAGARFVSGIQIGEFERRLDPFAFMRVHRSHVVSLRCVRALKRDGDAASLVMDNAAHDEVPVSRAHMTRVKTVLGVR